MLNRPRFFLFPVQDPIHVLVGAGDPRTQTHTHVLNRPRFFLFPVQDPIHVLVGAGDPVRCDSLWQLPAMTEWVRHPDPQARVQQPFTQEMEQQVGRVCESKCCYAYVCACMFVCIAGVCMRMTCCGSCLP